MLSVGQQLFINSKWYFDVFDIKDNTVEVRIKFYEGTDKKLSRYKTIKLPIDIITVVNTVNDITYCKIDEYKLKETIGSLITRLVKEADINKIFEDGMGAVVSAGVGAIPGTAGTAGSGDIMPNNEYGLMIHPSMNKKIRKKLKTKVGKPAIKQPILNIAKENLDIQQETDADYKTTLFMFLDYPYELDMDIKFIKMINKIRPSFLQVSSERIKSYFKSLYEINKSLIEKSTSEYFQNMILKLSEI